MTVSAIVTGGRICDPLYQGPIRIVVQEELSGSLVAPEELVGVVSASDLTGTVTAPDALQGTLEDTAIQGTISADTLTGTIACED